MEEAEKLLIPFLLVKISCDYPPTHHRHHHHHHHQKFVGLRIMSCRGHNMQKSLPLPAGVAVRSLDRVFEGVQGAESTEAPKIQEILTGKLGWGHNNVNGKRHSNVGNCLENLPRIEEWLNILV